MKKLLLIGGTRPNFMKLAPLVWELEKNKEVFSFVLIHTGQHYDKNMSQVFFDDLQMPAPHYYLDVKGGSNLQTTARVLESLEPVLLKEQPDLVLVVGDVNSTLAGALAAKQLHFKVAHIEAGLRSGDLSMPEEINRMATDSICDYFFTTEPSGKKYLLQGGISESKIFEVGNLMIDSLMYQIEKNKQSPSALIGDIITKYPKYIACTFHRPHNVDTAEAFGLLVDQLNKVAEEQTLVFPIHPRTRSRLQQFGLILSDNIVVLNPLGYAEFVQLVSGAACILTDSGGIQEETTYLGIPCLTVRPNTERPVTIEQGTNELIEVNNIYQKVGEVLDNSKKDVIIEMRDGGAAERIISHIKKIVL